MTIKPGKYNLKFEIEPIKEPKLEEKLHNIPPIKENQIVFRSDGVNINIYIQYHDDDKIKATTELYAILITLGRSKELSLILLRTLNELVNDHPDNFIFSEITNMYRDYIATRIYLPLVRPEDAMKNLLRNADVIAGNQDMREESF